MLRNRGFIVLILLIICLWPQISKSAGGAVLYLAPISESRQVGETFDLAVRVDSSNQAINAVSGVLNFSQNNLEVANISKAGSVLSLWVDGPIFNNDKGEIRFSGGLPSPGFQGTAGTILHIIFKAKSAGVGSIIWKKGVVLANDGSGTNIVSDLQGTDFGIEKAFFAPAVAPPLGASPFLYLSIALFFILLASGLYWVYKLKLYKRLNLQSFHLKRAVSHDFDLFKSEFMQEFEELENIKDLRELSEAEKSKREKLINDLNLIIKNLEQEIDASEKNLE